MQPFEAHHLCIEPEHMAGNGGRGRVVLVPGSLARTEQVAEHFEDLQVHPNPRRLDVYLGTLRDGDRSVDVAAVPTGMGCPSLGIVLTELIELGARRFLRVGSAGSLQPQVAVGDLVVATGAVRDEGASDAYVPREVPALAHSDWLVALASAAKKRGELDHACRNAEIGCFDCKKVLAANLSARLAPIQERYGELSAASGRVEEILAAGGERARTAAEASMAKIRNAMGLDGWRR